MTQTPSSPSNQPTTPSQPPSTTEPTPKKGGCGYVVAALLCGFAAFVFFNFGAHFRGFNQLHWYGILTSCATLYFLIKAAS